MTETDLEQLIANWYQRHGVEDERRLPAATADCPPLTRLWRHVAEGHPLDEYQDHVGQCDRCRRLCAIIEREREATAAAERKRPLVRIYAGGGLLAAAASIALLVVSWPQPSFDAEVAAFMYQAYEITSPVRGDGEEAPAAEAPQQTAWVTAALADPGVQDALATHDWTEGLILHELRQGRLRIDPDGRLALADGVGETTPARRDRVLRFIQEDRAACETIIDALVRHVPGATPKDRARLERAFNRRRAKRVFGTD